MSEFEQQWAVALKKAQQQTQIPTANKIRTVKEKINIDKKKLKIALSGDNKKQIQKLYDSLIHLRAKLCSLQMLIEQKTAGYLDEITQNRLIKNYSTDCLKLKRTLTTFLN